MSVLAPGDVLDGKYVVDRTLGKGGMGLVVAARHVASNANVAIKVLLPDARSSDNVRRFRREARAALRLLSPHAARVHDVGELADGTPYMVMDLLVGTDLEALLRKRGRLSTSEAVGFVLEALDAVEEAHGLGIIHRDLKPANLFLADQDARPPMVKVLDFGIARDFKESGDLKLTKTGDVMGSPAYMSPEQMIQARDADARSDIWSLGACLYELLTGTLPFNGKTLAELCEKVQCATPAAPSSLRADVPAALSAVVLRCLDKEPARRFGSAAELTKALAAWAPTPVRASTSTAPSASPSAPAPPGPTAPAFVDGTSTTQRFDAAPPLARGPTQRSSRRASAMALALALFVAVAIGAVMIWGRSPPPRAEIPPSSDTAFTVSRAPAPTTSAVAVPEALPAPPPTTAPDPTPTSRAPPATPPPTARPRPVARGALPAPSPSSAAARPPAAAAPPAFDPKTEF